MAILTYNRIYDFIINTTIINKVVQRNTTKKISINMYLFDGLSRFRFRKQMKYTTKYLNILPRKYKIFDMMKYHTLGRNSELNYKGLFTGNKSRSIFELFKKYNYTLVAMPGSYDPNLSFFGKSNKQYVDYNIQLFRNCSNKYLYGEKIRCLGNKQRHNHQLDSLESLLQQSISYYNPVFSYTSFMESHDSSFTSLLRIDEDVKNHLKNLEYEGILEKSITILIGDHGIHYGDYFNTSVYSFV